MVVLDEVRLELVGITLEEPVIALEAEAERPAREGSGIRSLIARDQMPLSNGARGPTGIAQDPSRGGRAGMDAAGVARVVEGDVGHEAHAHAMSIAAGEERRPGGRTHGGDVEPRVPEALGGESIDVGCRDGRTETAEMPEPGVVEDDR